MLISAVALGIAFVAFLPMSRSELIWTDGATSDVVIVNDGSASTAPDSTPVEMAPLELIWT
jgi:hypothetical protein